MATLTNTKIKDTYDGLLKTTDNEALDVSGVTLIEDGLGNASALSVGRSGNGVSVSGLLDVSGEVQGTSLDINGAADISGNLAVDTNTLYVDAANDKVGIGTVPSTKLHLGGTAPLDSIIRQDSTLSGTNWEIGEREAGKWQIWEDDTDSVVATFTSSGNVEISDGRLQVNTNSATGAVVRLDWNSTDSIRRINALEIGGGNARPLQIHAQDVRFRDDSSERMRIDSSGNVGIGNVNPAAYGKFVVNGTGEILNVVSTSGKARLGLWEGATGRMFIDTLNGSDGIAFVDGDGTSERMRIDSSGNVSIGSSTAFGHDLFVKGKSGAAGVVYAVGNSSSHRGEFAVEASGQFTGGFAAVPSGASTYNGIPASTVGITTSSTPLVFATSNSERMRITSGGYLKASNNGSYVGATSSYHELKSDAADLTLYCYNTNASGDGIFTRVDASNTTNYVFRGFAGGSTRVIIYSNGNIVNDNNSYGAISDIKLKENIVDASPKLDDLMQIKIRNYNLIGDDKKQLGVVAQELEEVFPSMIDESPDFEEQEVIDEEGNVTKERVDLGTTTKSVKYSVFVPMLIKAMQEQQEIINDLKARIETLEAK